MGSEMCIRDSIDRALKRMSLEEDKNLTEAVNEILRNGLAKYL